jgi:hypothetical protein
MFSFLSLISRLGLLRFLLQIKGTSVAPDFVRKLPIEVQPVILAKFLPKTFATAIAEKSLMASSAKQVQQTKFARELPLVVLSHSENMFSSQGNPKSDRQAWAPPNRAEQIWQKLQAEMANLSNQGQLIVVEGSSHKPTFRTSKCSIEVS